MKDEHRVVEAVVEILPPAVTSTKPQTLGWDLLGFMVAWIGRVLKTDIIFHLTIVLGSKIGFLLDWSSFFFDFQGDMLWGTPKGMSKPARHNLEANSTPPGSRKEQNPTTLIVENSPPPPPPNSSLLFTGVIL